MSADNYIQLSNQTYLGAQALSIRDQVANLINDTNLVVQAAAKSVADDGTYVKLAALYGINGVNAAADAQSVHDLLGTLYANLTTTGNFLSVRDGIQRNY